jgi:hypothetical protein
MTRRPKATSYIMGLATRLLEGGRSDVVIVDTAQWKRPRCDDKLPIRAPTDSRLVGVG